MTETIGHAKIVGNDVSGKTTKRNSMRHQQKGERKHQGIQQKKWGDNIQHKHLGGHLMGSDALRCVKLLEVSV